MILSQLRVRTALLLVLAVAVALSLREGYDTAWIWQGLVALAAIIAIFEWACLFGQDKVQIITLLLSGLLATSGALWLPLEYFTSVHILALVLWVAFALRLCVRRWPIILEVILQMNIGMLAIPIAAVLLMWMPTSDLLLLLLWVAAVDIGGYEFGRRFGKTLLAPDISPNKTRAGFVGGVGGAVLLALLLAVVLGLEPVGWFVFVAFAALCACFAVVGDLAESLLKRIAGAKDSGVLLPGHGGVLDRVDSIIAITPVFALGMQVIRPAAGVP